MKKIFKIILTILVIAFIAIQFIRPDKIIDSHPAEVAINNTFEVPESVMTTFKNSCYDCHSDEINYPWYWNVQPARWILNDHILEGRRELNFSAIGGYPIYRQYKKLHEIKEEIEEGKMPMKGYTVIHSGTSLTESQKNEIYAWTEQARAAMEAKYPADSLLKKK
ncbi:MAG: heme-binding domain-containing protein [Chitinophagaceae bacterium]|nr:heme-binding domain-containing protein [Chitinophagaceae bacterium]